MWPYLTSELEGCGGTVKSTPEDFRVSELPLYPACGEGTHIYMTIEKRGLTTLEAARRVARALGRQPADVGYAGMKDAQGVTQQRFSVEHVDAQRVAALCVDGVRVIEVARHTNKLRLGHLGGNRFDIRLRECRPDAAELAAAIGAVLARRGVPNYFGVQRFGRRGRNAEIGCAALQENYADVFGWLLGRAAETDAPAERRAREFYDAGDVDAAATAWPGYCRDEARICRIIAERGADAAAWRAIDRRVRTLYCSAAQSAAFNRVLASRILAPDRLLDGDLAWKHVNGACFAVTDAAAEQPRCDRFEISATGPVPGARMTAPAGAPAELEQKVIAELGLAQVARRTPDGIRLDGARRPLRVPLTDLEVTADRDRSGEFLRLSFTLPAGAYATSLIREVSKSG